MTNTTDTWKQNADRAMELFERKRPEQLAVELVQMQDKHTQAMAALDRMQDQRDQLAAQHKDATRQCGVMADLLRELREGAEIHLHNCTVCKNEKGIANWTSKLERIDAMLAGQVTLLSNDQSLLDWAVTSWHEQVAHRPMENVYRRTLDSVWRQVIRFAGEDPQSLIGPSHDDLLHATPKPEGGER